jgi:hypothetical protein
VPLRRLIGMVAFAALLLGCATGSSHEVAGSDGPIIDGWPIVEVCDCAGKTPLRDELIRAATAALDHRDGLHPAIVRATLEYEAAGAPIRTIGNTVAVFVLADGSRRAIFVGNNPGSPLTVDYGP